MDPNSALDQDSRLRKAIRSTGLVIGRITSEVKTRAGEQFVDVFAGDAGSDYKDVPILRASTDFVSLPKGTAVETNKDVLKHGVNVLLGFLYGTRSPVVLGVVNSGGGGPLKTVRSDESRTGDKELDNGLPVAYSGDRMLSNEENGSRIIIRSADGDISVFVWDLDLDAYNKAKSPEDREQILIESLASSPDFSVFLYGMQSSFRIIRNSTNQTVELTNDNERVLNARYWGMYKNLVEYPYIASLAYRIRSLEDLMDAIAKVMEALKVLAGAGNPIEIVNALPKLLEAVQTFIDLLLGKSPKTVRSQMAVGFDPEKVLTSVLFVRDQGGDTFLPLAAYAAIAKQLGLTATSVANGDQVDRPFGFGGSDQIPPLGLPFEINLQEEIAKEMGELEILPGTKLKNVPGAPDAVKAALEGVAFPTDFTDSFPGSAGPMVWESLMSSLIHLGVHYAGTASGTHLGLTEE